MVQFCKILPYYLRALRIITESASVIPTFQFIPLKKNQDIEFVKIKYSVYQIVSK